MSRKRRKKKVTPYIIAILTIILVTFIVLKTCHVIDWDLASILAPFWALAVLAFVIYGCRRIWWGARRGR